MKNVKKRVYLPIGIVVWLVITFVLYTRGTGFFGVMGEVDNETLLKNEAQMEVEERDSSVLVYEGYGLNTIDFWWRHALDIEAFRQYSREGKDKISLGKYSEVRITTFNRNQELFIEKFFESLKMHYGAKFTLNWEDKDKQEIVWNIFHIFFSPKDFDMHYVGVLKDKGTFHIIELEEDDGYGMASITNYKNRDKVEVLIYDEKLRQEFSERIKEVLGGNK